MEKTIRCPNMNHSKSNSMVNFCPNCGESLRQIILAPRCSESSHGEKRKARDAYCIDCGKKL